MTDREMPSLWRALLAEAAVAPEGILSLKEDPRGEEAVDAAERLTDLGFLRIVTARRYRLSEAGEALLASEGRRRKKAGGPRASSGSGETGPETAGPEKASKQAPGLWGRLFGGKS